MKQAEAPFFVESPFYNVTKKGVRCLICPHSCLLSEGMTGTCRTHGVQNGKLVTTAYGNPCSLNVDPVEKKPLYHFLPSSRCYSIAIEGCNLSCLNCQNSVISQQHPRSNLLMDTSADKIVHGALSSGCKSIAFTYTEPISWIEFTMDTARFAKSNGLNNILVTNGYCNPGPGRALSEVITAANIDLKAFSDDIYLKLTGGHLKPVLKFLEILKREGVWIEITNLLIPGWTDNLWMIKEMCNWLYKNGFEDNPLHFSRFYPCYKLNEVRQTPVEILRQARFIALEAGLRYIYIGNVQGHESADTYCPSCHERVIERDVFSVISNSLIDGRCPNCQYIQPGIWH